MRNRSRGARFASALAALMATTLQPGVIPSANGAEAYQAARTADGKPNLNGIWQALNTANWDIQEHAARPGLVVALGAVGAVPAGLGVVEGDEIPYLPAAAAKKKENFENRLTADPEIKCYLPGVPRAAYMPYPFQIVQTPNYILMAYIDAIGRAIEDERKLPDVTKRSTKGSEPAPKERYAEEEDE